MYDAADLRHVCRCLLSGQTLMRALMNRALSRESIGGLVVDVGGGRDPDYVTYLRKSGPVTIVPIDGSISGVDFETDALPYGIGEADAVLLCNVLEHVYRHQWLLEEIRRILKPEGRLVGFVPFWIGYHPDPRDYFRYTEAALQRMFADAGYGEARVQAIGGGPVLANFNTLVSFVPRWFRPLFYLPYLALDMGLLAVRPHLRRRNPLGFVFVVRQRKSNAA